MQAKHTRNLYSRDFVLVAVGQIISIFGNQILRYAIPLYLLSETGSAALFGTISALAFIPMLLLYPVGGILADRLNKRNIMVYLDFGTALLILLFYLLQGRMDIVPLAAATLIVLYAIQGAYQPAVKASVPILVEEDHLVQANAVVDVINSVASMAGPVLGGILFSFFGLAPILSISIGCFAASAVLEIFIRIAYEKSERTGNIIRIGFSDLKESFHFMIRRQSVLWQISLVYAAVNLLLITLVLIASPAIITQHLGFPPELANRLYGYGEGAMAAGAVLGGVLAGTLVKHMRPRQSPLILLACSLAILIGGLALQFLKTSAVVYIVLIVAFAGLIALSTLYQIQLMSYIQILTPQNLVGRIISCVICLSMCTNPLGQFVYGLVFERVTMLYLPFYIAAALMAGVTVLAVPLFSRVDEVLEARRAASIGAKAAGVAISE